MTNKRRSRLSKKGGGEYSKAGNDVDDSGKDLETPSQTEVVDAEKDNHHLLQGPIINGDSEHPQTSTQEVSTTTEADQSTGTNANHVEPIDPESQNEMDTNHSGTSDIEDADEDDEPPKLKYSRINQLPSNFFNKDPVSSCFFHEEYFIFATHSGFIHICTSKFVAVRTFKAHRASVLSTYTDGRFFASASMDGTVVIGSIEDEKDIIAYDFQRPVHAVVLDSNYASKRSFISGGMSGKVIYSRKNWLGKKTDFVIDQNNGAVVGLTIIGDLVIWMNDKGINVFHLSNRVMIKVLEKPSDSPRNDLYWPRVTQPDTDRLIIAWSNYIWSLRISLKDNSAPNAKDSDSVPVVSSGMSRILPSTASISFRATQEKKVEVEHIFKLDDLICGIASYKDDLWMVLTYEPPKRKSLDKASGETATDNNPDLKLINSTTGDVEFEEELALKNIQNLGLNDFTLGAHIDQVPKYFIISAKDGVVAQEYQLDDRLQWYLERDEFLRAYEVSEHIVSPMKRLSFGIQYVDSLVKEDEWKKAAEFLKNLLPLRDEAGLEEQTSSPDEEELTSQHASHPVDEMRKEIISQWQIWAHIFINSGHIDELSLVIPKVSALPAGLFTKIFTYWIENGAERACELISDWPTELYDNNTIESDLKKQESHLKDANSEHYNHIERALVTFYDKTFQPLKAVPRLEKLKDKHIVEYLAKNHILKNFVSQLPTFITLQFDDDEAISRWPIDKLGEKLSPTVDTLVDHRLEIPSSEIVELFKSHPRLSFINYFYLARLQEIDKLLVKDYGDELIELYSNYSRRNLLPFFVASDENDSLQNTYDVDKAIEICKQNNFYQELIYLLGKIGENKQALNLVINKLGDPQMAIEFAKRLNDKDTWSSLIDQSLDKPNFLKILIEQSDESTNPFYDPVSILTKITTKFDSGSKVGENDDGLDEVHSQIYRQLSQSIIEFSKNNDLNRLINQVVLKMIDQSSQEIAQFLKQSLLSGRQYDLEKDDEKSVQIETSLQNWEPIVLN
ncbi:VPS41 [Candida theae]|uniref:VPS41 n=1 Tax=Candida theae TaxID=1198502 RepID=A0AAD5BF46_9ASCO|nr:VPS41 [Candida theae]KAI5958800.1 VPS41 [Candida theae]